MDKRVILQLSIHILNLAAWKDRVKTSSTRLTLWDFLWTNRIPPPFLSFLLDGTAENRPVQNSEVLSILASSSLLWSQDSVTMAMLMLWLRNYSTIAPSLPQIDCALNKLIHIWVLSLFFNGILLVIRTITNIFLLDPLCPLCFDLLLPPPLWPHLFNLSLLIVLTVDGLRVAHL